MSRTFVSFYAFTSRAHAARFYSVRIRLTPAGERRRAGRPVSS
jgi:hypothetical protein